MTSTRKDPKVSVLMPIYNAGQYLKQAIDSILDQTFTDFELIAINDGSTDDSGKILDHYKDFDNRIVVIQRENRGLVATLNEAIELAKGEYLARQDSDDISFPTRLEKQVEVLRNNKNVVLVSGGFEVFDEENEFIYREVIPVYDEDIKRAMYLRNPIGHGSVMFRKSACIDVGMYSKSCGPTEDYELWSRLAKKGRFYALEASVFHWRVNSKGITSNNGKIQAEMMRRHIDKLWEAGFPRVIKTRELHKKGNHYYKSYGKRGVDMKNIMLSDNAQLAVKMIRRGSFLRGLRQLVAVLLVGRSGVKAVIYRMQQIRRGTVQAIRRKLTLEQQS